MRYFILTKAASYGLNIPIAGHTHFIQGTVYPVEHPWVGEVLDANEHFTETDKDGYPLQEATPQEISKKSAMTYTRMGDQPPQVSQTAESAPAPTLHSDPAAKKKTTKKTSKKKTSKKKASKKKASRLF
jgi:hypothetical protein